MNEQSVMLLIDYCFMALHSRPFGYRNIEERYIAVGGGGNSSVLIPIAAPFIYVMYYPKKRRF